MKKIFSYIINIPLSFIGLKLVLKKSLDLLMEPPPHMPIEVSQNNKNLIELCGKYSWTGPVRMWSLIQALKYIQKHNIEGDLIECGVWRGGNLGLMSLLSEQLDISKKVFGYDTFDGMTDPEEVDVDWQGLSSKEAMQNSPKDEKITNIHCFASLNQVKNNLIQMGVKDNVTLIQGKVEETLLVDENIPQKISLLRLDTDWYQSTKTELEILYPRLQPGGILIIDDYGHHKGAQKAVDEYFKGQNVWLHYIDYTCRLMIKDR